MKTYLLAILLLASKVAISQSISTLMGAQVAGMGYASVGTVGPWAIMNNPGGIANNLKLSSGVAYDVRPQFTGANRMAAIINIPTSLGVTSGSFFRFGDDLYNEQIVGVGFGNKIGIASLGTKLNLVQYQTQGMGAMYALTIDFGGISQITETISINAYITNVNQAKINQDTEERLPTRLTAGITYRLNNKIIITSEITKQLGYSPSWKSGMEYCLKDYIFFRTGFNANPSAAFFGLGFLKKRVQFDFATQFNRYLGASYQASATYTITKKATE